MAIRRAPGADVRPVIMLLALGAVGWLCALLVGRMDRLRTDVCRTIDGIEGQLLTRVDELCVAAHTVGMAAEAARAAGAASPPLDLAAEAEEAERVAEAEDRGERAPTKGQRARVSGGPGSTPAGRERPA